jgi:hypothetical protein
VPEELSTDDPQQTVVLAKDVNGDGSGELPVGDGKQVSEDELGASPGRPGSGVQRKVWPETEDGSLDASADFANKSGEGVVVAEEEGEPSSEVKAKAAEERTGGAEEEEEEEEPSYDVTPKVVAEGPANGDGVTEGGTVDLGSSNEQDVTGDYEQATEDQSNGCHCGCRTNRVLVKSDF